MQDELFRPTIQQRSAPDEPPWRPESIMYPAMFGGPLAATTLGVLNGRRLGLSGRQLLAIGAAGLVAFGARLAIGAATDGVSVVRVAGMLTGALVWLVVLSFQRAPFRAYSYGGGEPASLVAPGFAAVICCGVPESLLILGLVR
jgi:hypothetical protein